MSGRALPALHLLAVSLVECVARNLRAVDDGDVVSTADHRVVAGEAEEDEGRKDQQQDQCQHQTLVLANRFKHVVPCLR